MNTDDTVGRRPLRVALVDDQSLVRAGFAMVVDSQPDLTVAWQAADGAEAIAKATADPADVILMDIRMPGMDGIEATRRLADSAAERNRIIVLTTFDIDDYVVEAIAAGASGFLLKDAQPETLLAAVRDVAAGESVLSARSAAHLLVAVRPLLAEGPAGGERRPPRGEGMAPLPTAQVPRPRTAPPPVPAAPATAPHSAPAPTVPQDVVLPEALTEREEEILRLVGLGYSNADIAEHLVIAMPTVKTHVGRLLAKTASRDRVHLVLFAVRTGRVDFAELDDATVNADAALNANASARRHPPV